MEDDDRNGNCIGGGDDRGKQSCHVAAEESERAAAAEHNGGAEAVGLLEARILGRKKKAKSKRREVERKAKREKIKREFGVAVVPRMGGVEIRTVPLPVDLRLICVQSLVLDFRLTQQTALYPSIETVREIIRVFI